MSIIGFIVVGLLAGGALAVPSVRERIGFETRVQRDKTLMTAPVRKAPFQLTITEKGTLDSMRNAILVSKVEGSTTIISIVPEGLDEHTEDSPGAAGVLAGTVPPALSAGFLCVIWLLSTFLKPFVTSSPLFSCSNTAVMPPAAGAGAPVAGGGGGPGGGGGGGGGGAPPAAAGAAADDPLYCDTAMP